MFADGPAVCPYRRYPELVERASLRPYDLFHDFRIASRPTNCSESSTNWARRTPDFPRDFLSWGVLPGMTDRDPNLSQVLTSWRHEPPAAPRFNAEVWARIEAARQAPWAAAAIIARGLGIPAQHFRWALPLAASLVLVCAAVVGAGAGILHTSLAANDRMAAAYVQSIDPLQMTADHH
jgi:hypothetical protein